MLICISIDGIKGGRTQSVKEYAAALILTHGKALLVLRKTNS